MRTINAKIVTRAKALRRELSPPELKLWLALKAGSDGRCPFRKQHPLGPFVIDFYCAKPPVAVEVDGFVHSTDGQGERDERRDAWLADRGVQVVRIPAGDVMADAAGVADNLLRLVRPGLAAPSR